MNKSERHAAIRERAARALRDLYHNATPRYPRLGGREAEQFESWFGDTATDEIEYLSDGGAYGSDSDYLKTLQANCNAGKLKSERARQYYVAKGMRQMREERARCNSLDSRDGDLTNAQWERIGEFGKLYTWGRGGRTLAPNDLIKMGGGSSFSIKEDYADEMRIAAAVDLIRIVESFNRAVGNWCDDVPNMWREYYNEEFGGADVETVAELSETE